MPQFAPGATKTAKATLTNPTAKQFTYSVELYLGVTKAATSGVGTVTIPANSSRDVTFVVVMPAAEGNYAVYLDVWSDTTLLKHYQATENVVITVAVPPPGTSLYGKITSHTGASLSGARVELYGPSIAIVYSDSTGYYQAVNLTPGQYAITVSLGGYQTLSWNIMVSEGNNPLDIELTAIPAADLVTIDKFEMMCEFTNGYGVIHTRITITNHTGQTFIDQTPTGPYGGLVVQMGAEAYKYPGDIVLGDIFLMREYDRYGIGDLPPGTHEYQCDLPVQGTKQVDTSAVPWNWFETYGIVQGTRGFVHVRFFAGNEAPPTTFATAEKNFEGIFSADWQTWGPTDWTPPPPPEIPVIAGLAAAEISSTLAPVITIAMLGVMMTTIAKALSWGLR